MKIKVNDIDPNPYRKIEKYPIRRDKVEKLKSSIDNTGFWDNIIARKNGNRYQIAYGHHRLVAVKESGITEVDIPIKILDDETMIKIMANENMEDWETNTAVINETVFTVKEFLGKFPQKHVGVKEIHKFLGKAWSEDTIKTALATIKDETIDREAVEVFDTPYHSHTLRNEIKKDLYGGVIPKEEQKQFAQEIKRELENEDGEVTGEGIKRKVFEKVSKKISKPEKVILERSWRYKKCTGQWYEAMRTVQGIDILASDLTAEEVSQVEKLIAKIETKIQEWRNG